MGDVDLDLVWVRCFQWKGRDVFTLARESALNRWLTAADVREILGDELPVVAYDDSGPGGALIFPADADRGPDSRHPLSSTLAEQLRTAIRRKAATLPCPAESFPEPAAPDWSTHLEIDFAEPPGGESARVEREEAAHLDALRAKAAATEDVIYYGWKSGDRFEIGPVDDVSRSWAAGHLWMTWGGATCGSVVCRCDVQVSGHNTTPGLLVECEGLRRATVVDPRVLSVCARKVL